MEASLTIRHKCNRTAEFTMVVLTLGCAVNHIWVESSSLLTIHYGLCQADSVISLSLSFFICMMETIVPLFPEYCEDSITK